MVFTNTYSLQGSDSMIDINGMAHVILTVSQFDAAHKFYSGLLPEFGMTKVNDGPDLLYYVGAVSYTHLRAHET